MTIHAHAHAGPHPRRLRRLARLRHVLVRLARALSLDEDDLAAYARVECGRPWYSLGQPDLLLLLGNLREIAACRAELRRARAAHRSGEDTDA